MIASLILVFSVAALIQFAVSQWRSMWIDVAEQPLSKSFETATGIAAGAVDSEDFTVLIQAWEQLPAAPRERNSWLKEVRIYYRTLRAISNSSERMFPALAERTKKETAMCAKYVAAILDERLNASLAYAAQTQN